MAAGLTVVFQLFYPAARMLPSVEVGNYNAGGQTVAEAQAGLEKQYRGARITMQAGDKKIAATLDEIGVDVDTAASAQAARRYPWYERLVPFSSLYIMIGRDVSTRARYDADRLQYFADQASATAYAAPVNASVAFKDGEVVLLPAKPGDVYAASSIGGVIKSAKLLPDTRLKLTPTHQPAKRQDKDVEGVLAKARQAADMSLTVSVDGDKTKVDKAAIGGWLDFAEDSAGRLNLALKPDAVKTYLQGIQSKIYKAPGTTVVQITNNKESSRTTGATGRGLDIDRSIGLLTAAVLKAEKTTVDLPVSQTAPSTSYKRSYTHDSDGLTALLGYLVQNKGDYGISVREIGGLSASASGSKQYTSASTYKLFVAYGVFQWINSGQMHWSDPMVNGYNAEGCFDAMIVKSDNSCAVALGQTVGWQNINDMMTDLGLTNTQVVSGDQRTTANDLALFLYKLQSGTLLSSGDRTRLLDDMKRQIYRQGIPAGTGVTVANKVGFLYALLHDAGIVYGPKSTYVVVIMSNNSSWSQLADAAKQIHNFLD